VTAASGIDKLSKVDSSGIPLNLHLDGAMYKTIVNPDDARGLARAIAKEKLKRHGQ
jgi:hypothetical protein